MTLSDLFYEKERFDDSHIGVIFRIIVNFVLEGNKDFVEVSFSLFCLVQKRNLILKTNLNRMLSLKMPPNQREIQQRKRMERTRSPHVVVWTTGDITRPHSRLRLSPMQSREPIKKLSHASIT